MPSLNGRYAVEKRHLAILEHQAGTLVALAGPGTGKTYCLRKRIRELIKRRRAPARSIAYITFIREIAEDFREQLTKEFGDAGSVPEVTVSTLHALALRLIRNLGHMVGVSGQLEPLNIDSQKDVLAQILRKDILDHLQPADTRMTLRSVRSHLRSAKKQWQRGVEYPHIGEKGQPIMETYERLSKGLKAIDWDHVVVYANQICQELPRLPSWLHIVEHFLIDEYQDFNPAEQRFLREIRAGAKSVVIVGDDDQSLYSSRGASPEEMRKIFSSPEADTVSLVVSYRCRKEIVRAANRFLDYMKDKPRRLVAYKEGGRVKIKSFKSAKAEVDFLAAHIGSILRTIPTEASPREGVACLFPSRTVRRQYQKELESRGVMCSVKRAVQLTNEQMWARVLARLAALGTQPLLERALLKKFPDFKPRHQKQIIIKVLSEECTIREAILMLRKGERWEENAKVAAEQYEKFLDALTSADPEPVAACFESILNSAAKCDPDVIEQFLEMADEGNLEDAVLALLRRIFPSDSLGKDQPEVRAVELMTMHGAKGLTRKYVILPGCEDYWLPSRARGAQPPEQKRLFYVALTRARDEVLITYPKNRARNDSLNYRKPGCGELSRFAKQVIPALYPA